MEKLLMLKYHRNPLYQLDAAIVLTIRPMILATVRKNLTGKKLACILDDGYDQPMVDEMGIFLAFFWYIWPLDGSYR